MFIISCLILNEPTLCAFDTKAQATNHVKTANGDTVIENVFEVDKNGNVTFYEVDFEGQVVLNPVVSNG